MRPFLEGSAAPVAAVLLPVRDTKVLYCPLPRVACEQDSILNLISQTLESYLLGLGVYLKYFSFVVYTGMRTKVEKSTLRNTQGTDVCPVDYVNGLLFTVKFFLVWHLTFAQLLLYFMNTPACQCLEMQGFHAAH